MYVQVTDSKDMLIKQRHRDHSLNYWLHLLIVERGGGHHSLINIKVIRIGF